MVSEEQLQEWERLANQESVDLKECLEGLRACRILIPAYRTLAARLGEAEKQLEKVRELEWNVSPYLARYCYYCKKTPTMGHASDCPLAAALAPGAGDGEEAT